MTSRYWTVVEPLRLWVPANVDTFNGARVIFGDRRGLEQALRFIHDSPAIIEVSIHLKPEAEVRFTRWPGDRRDPQHFVGIEILSIRNGITS